MDGDAGSSSSTPPASRSPRSTTPRTSPRCRPRASSTCSTSAPTSKLFGWPRRCSRRASTQLLSSTRRSTTRRSSSPAAPRSTARTSGSTARPSRRPDEPRDAALREVAEAPPPAPARTTSACSPGRPASCSPQGRRAGGQADPSLADRVAEPVDNYTGNGLFGPQHVGKKVTAAATGSSPSRAASGCEKARSTSAAGLRKVWGVIGDECIPGVHVHRVVHGSAYAIAASAWC